MCLPREEVEPSQHPESSGVGLIASKAEKLGRLLYFGTMAVNRELSLSEE
jgi:hypothetical protein